MIELIFGFIFLIVGGICGFLGFKKGNESGLLGTYVPVDSIKNIPQDVPFVIHGTAASGQPLISPLTQQQCVYYHYEVQSRETNRDANGAQTSQWRTLVNDTQSVPFFLSDASGQIAVYPDGTEVNGLAKNERMLRPGSVSNIPALKDHAFLAAAVMVSENISNLQSNEKAIESVIPINSELNVFGSWSLQGNQGVIQKTQQYPLVLSPKTKDQLVSAEKKSEWIYIIAAIFMAIIGIILLGLYFKLF